MKDLKRVNELREAAAIDPLLAYLETLLTRYQWHTDRVAQLRNAISVIKARQSDPHLYLGIVGEFSSGKSTLINTLIRDDFLKTDNLQGTTTSLTAFRYGEQMDMTIEYNTGKSLVYSKDNRSINKLYQQRSSEVPEAFPGFFSTLLKRIFQHTQKKDHKENIRQLTQMMAADENFSRDIKQLTIMYPSEALKNGLVIIDTPGVQSMNKRHLEVTQRALQQVCDVALILIQSTVPASASLMGFLNNHSVDIPVHRCVFVVTKIDQIRAAERQRLLDMIRKKLASELGTPAPLVIGVSALAAFESLLPAAPVSGYFADTAPDERDQLLQHFLTTESGIYQALNQQKLAIQLERLIKLTTALFEEMIHGLQHFEQVYAAEKAALEKNKIPDLADFTRERQAHYAQLFRQDTLQYKEELTDYISDYWGDFMNDSRSKLYKADSIKELKAAVEHISDLAGGQQNRLQQQVSVILGQLSTVANNQKNDFETGFYKKYQLLASLGGQLKPVKTGSSSPGTGKGFGTQLSAYSVGTVVDQASNVENITIGASFVTGATIGTIILPGIGTAIGAALGWLFGKLFGPSVDKVRSECLPQIETAVYSICNQWISNGTEAFTQAVAHIQKEFDDVINQYMEKYKLLVYQMHERDRLELIHLEALRKQVTGDLQELETRKGLLITAKNNLFTI